MLKVKLKDEKLTFSPMKGKPGHCFAAQVWDSYGYNVASIDSMHGAIKATMYAKLFAASLNMNRALIKVIESNKNFGEDSSNRKICRIEQSDWDIILQAVEQSGLACK